MSRLAPHERKRARPSHGTRARPTPLQRPPISASKLISLLIQIIRRADADAKRFSLSFVSSPLIRNLIIRPPLDTRNTQQLMMYFFNLPRNERTWWRVSTVRDDQMTLYPPATLHHNEHETAALQLYDINTAWVIVAGWFSEHSHTHFSLQ